MSKQYLKVEYRDIAKMLVRALPAEDKGYLIVEEYLETIKALPRETKLALKVAYIFSRKVPRQEREDLFQDIALAVFKAKTPEEKLAYAIARCDWRNWWEKYSIRQHYSLDTVIEDDEGSPVALSELLVGEVEFERKMNGKLDAERIWDKLPTIIRPLVDKRLIGKPLTATERKQMSRYVKNEGYRLLLAS